MTTKILKSEDPMGVAQVVINPYETMQVELGVLKDANTHAWAVAKSLQTQLDIAEGALKEMVGDANYLDATERVATGSEFNNCIARAEKAMRQLENHRAS